MAERCRGCQELAAKADHPFLRLYGPITAPEASQRANGVMMPSPGSRGRGFQKRKRWLSAEMQTRRETVRVVYQTSPERPGRLAVLRHGGGEENRRSRWAVYDQSRHPPLVPPHSARSTKKSPSVPRARHSHSCLGAMRPPSTRSLVPGSAKPATKRPEPAEK